MKLKIRAHPNSKSPKIKKDIKGRIHIYVSEPAKKGKANEAVIESLAEYLETSKSAIKILHGQNSRSKLIEITK